MTVSIKIAAVSYINTIPFVYGLEHTSEGLFADLSLAIPRKCAELFKEQKVDVALVPLATTQEFSDYKIITPYCISADSSVRTVMLMSDVELSKIETIYLDSHSRTSVELVRILASEYWGITPEYKELTNYDLVDQKHGNSAFLLIGDKVFEHEAKFSVKYDLADEWMDFTGKPFVFAVWVAHKNVSEKSIESLTNALKYGVSNIEKAVKKNKYKDQEFIIKYLTNNIKFSLTDDKREGMKLFMRYLKQESEPSSYL